LIGDNVEYEDDIRSELIQLIYEYNMSDRILLLGQRDDVPQILPHANISVVPTELPEALCGVNIEAMAAKVPVVATKVGSIEEVVEDGKTGLLVEPANPKDMADAIIRILRNDNLACELACSGYERFLLKFTAQNMAAYIEQVYGKLLNVMTFSSLENVTDKKQ